MKDLTALALMLTPALTCIVCAAWLANNDHPAFAVGLMVAGILMAPKKIKID